MPSDVYPMPLFLYPMTSDLHPTTSDEIFLMYYVHSLLTTSVLLACPVFFISFPENIHAFHKKSASLLL